MLHVTEHYKIVQTYRNGIGSNESFFIILSSHLDFFPENCGSVCDAHGERFHQDIAAMEGKYNGKWSPSMPADYCWTLMRDSPNSTFNWKAKKD